MRLYLYDRIEEMFYLNVIFIASIFFFFDVAIN